MAKWQITEHLPYLNKIWKRPEHWVNKKPHNSGLYHIDSRSCACRKPAVSKRTESFTIGPGKISDHCS